MELHELISDFTSFCFLLHVLCKLNNVRRSRWSHRCVSRLLRCGMGGLFSQQIQHFVFCSTWGWYLCLLRSLFSLSLSGAFWQTACVVTQGNWRNTWNCKAAKGSESIQVYRCCSDKDWVVGSFQMFFIFSPTQGNDPLWLIFVVFKWVETTN